LREFEGDEGRPELAVAQWKVYRKDVKEEGIMNPLYCQKSDCENSMDIYNAKVKTIKYNGKEYDLILCGVCFNELELLENEQPK